MVILKIEENDEPIEFLSLLPDNYDFNIRKSIKTIKKHNIKKVALQLPDGLLRYTIGLKKILSKYTDCVILGDVVYGACCVDDISAKKIGSDLLIHYGHSCLISVTEMELRCLYVFVDIRFEYQHLKEIFSKHFENKNVAVLSTVQFLTAVQFLKKEFPVIEVPRINPLSSGEVLGCTSPKLKSDIVLFIGDGRFHLESVMLSNPEKTFYKYCPSLKKLTVEEYDHKTVIDTRLKEQEKFFSSNKIGVIISGLGRQTNPILLSNVINKIKELKKKVFLIKLQEIKSELLDKFHFIESFVQLNCTRLSIDWGASFNKPIINSFELFNYNFKKYEMDFYSKEGDAVWKNYNNKL